MIQCADKNYTSLLNFSEPIHTAYCVKWGYDYWCVRGHVAERRHPYWNKVALLHAARAYGVYDMAVWIDADALVLDNTIDIAKCLMPDKWLGVTLCPPEYPSEWSPSHRQAGVYYIRLDGSSDDFLANAWGMSLQEENDETAFNRLLAECSWHSSGCQHLEKKYHCSSSFGGVEDSFVVGWHGMGTPENRIQLMANEAMRRQIITVHNGMVEYTI